MFKLPWHASHLPLQQCPSGPPPGPSPSPRCNATNYHEFWCTVANASENFDSLATRLHVNPTKLWEYNFLYDRNAGVQTGDLLRVPYDQCEPQPGVWDCHDVVAGDTLFSIAHGTASKIYNTTTLKNYNLVLWYPSLTSCLSL